MEDRNTERFISTDVATGSLFEPDIASSDAVEIHCNSENMRRTLARIVDELSQIDYMDFSKTERLVYDLAKEALEV